MCGQDPRHKAEAEGAITQPHMNPSAGSLYLEPASGTATANEPNCASKVSTRCLTYEVQDHSCAGSNGDKGQRANDMFTRRVLNVLPVLIDNDPSPQP